MDIKDMWVLGVTQSEKDSLLDGFPYEELIITLQSNSEPIDEYALNSVLDKMVEQQLENMRFLVQKNMDEILKRASN